jgi:hypothetical protein
MSEIEQIEHRYLGADGVVYEAGYTYDPSGGGSGEFVHVAAVQWADPESAEDWGDADTPRNDPARYWKVAELPAPSWAVVRWLRRQAAKAARQEPPPAAAKPADPPKSPARIRIVEDRDPRFGAASFAASMKEPDDAKR